MPFTPQVTNNLPTAKITNTTMNVLAENDIYLKVRADLVDQDLTDGSTPNFENITLDGMTGTVEGRIETNTADIATNSSNFSSNIDQAVKTINAPTFAGLTLTTSNYSTWSASTTPLIISSGFYMFEHN
ncbi:hypothetical protein, partial [Candidatus Venteria ishoeyi]|uniref:hypothetical protein n=1 Tax=Candidatus Venteria ishoeyi TaxID=1899563 RepID=UPI00255C80E0